MKGRKIWKKCVAGMLAAAMMMGMTLGVSAAENEEAAPNFDATQKGSVTIIKRIIQRHRIRLRVLHSTLQRSESLYRLKMTEASYLVFHWMRN